MADTDARPPGRPPGSRGPELLAIAREMFLEAGFERATMNEIARRAAISKSSLYGEHPSKDALFVAVVSDWTRQGRRAMRPFLDQLVETADVEQGLYEFTAVLVDAIVSPQVVEMRRLVAAEARRFPMWRRHTSRQVGTPTSLHSPTHWRRWTNAGDFRSTTPGSRPTSSSGSPPGRH